jgi:putative protease
VYDFTTFKDSQDEGFSLICDPQGSQVIPRKPFSITDKIPFLKESGFRRFVIDLSGQSLKKKDYKDLIYAVNNGIPLPRISRFNWKDGFWSGEQGKLKPHSPI